MAEEPYVSEKEGSALYSKIVAKAWAEQSFRARLIAKPKEVLREHGFVISDHIDVKVIPGKKTITWELPLPDKPDDLDEEALEEVLEHWPKLFICHC